MAIRCGALSLCVLMAVAALGAADFERDVIATSEGELVVTFIGHGTLMLEHGDLVVHVDPWSRLADYSTLPKADLVLVTHGHRDHLDATAIAAVRKDDTVIVVPRSVAETLGEGTVLDNGEATTVKGVHIEAVPAYNLVHTRPSGEPFHPKGEGNGYVITVGGARVYVAGDTENVPEMKDLSDIDVAFLPMNLPYTMTPEMVADAARAVRPRLLYPYHYGDTDPGELVSLLEEEAGIEIRIRSMK